MFEDEKFIPKREEPQSFEEAAAMYAVFALVWGVVLGLGILVVMR